MDDLVASRPMVAAAAVQNPGIWPCRPRPTKMTQMDDLVVSGPMVAAAVQNPRI